MAQYATSVEQLQQILRQVSPRHLGFGLGGVSFLVMLVGTCAAYSEGESLPPPRPRPPSAEQEAVTNYRFKETFYHAVIDEDCDKFKIPRVSLDLMKQRNRYRVEFTGSQRLRVGRSLNTKSLAIKAVKRRLWIGAEGQSMRARHWVLRITNRTDKHLAYRVTTVVNNRCMGKGALPHNAVALGPGQTIERSECLLRKTRVKVEQVEVLELSPLGFKYVSRLDPERLQYDSRTSAGHDYAGDRPCRMIPWRRIRDDLKREDARWFDIIDFYARHNCDEYVYSSGYSWAEKDLERLPVRGKQGS